MTDIKNNGGSTDDPSPREKEIKASEPNLIHADIDLSPF